MYAFTKVKPSDVARKSFTYELGVGNLHSRSRLARRSVEEKWNRHLKDLRDLLQPAGANAVGSLLIFLNLLKRQSKPVRKVGLAHFEH